MFSPHWLLTWCFLFNDGQVRKYDETLVKKEYCVQIAKTKWAEFYSSNADKISTFTVICKNKDNHYDSVKIVCDKNGSCNV